MIDNHAWLFPPNDDRPSGKRCSVLIRGETGIGKTRCVMRLSTENGPPLIYAVVPSEASAPHILGTLRAAIEADDALELQAPYLQMADALKRVARLQDPSGVAPSAFLAQVAATIESAYCAKHATISQLFDSRRSNAFQCAVALFLDALSVQTGRSPAELQARAESKSKLMHPHDPKTVILALDEVGKSLALVRGLVSNRDIHRALADALGFSNVHLYFAGTGTDAFVVPHGNLRWSTDPSRLQIVTLSPLDSEVAKREFAKKLLRDVADFDRIPRQADLLQLFTNPRLAFLFKRHLMHCCSAANDRGVTFSDKDVTHCMRTALREFSTLNGISDLSDAHQTLLMDVMYYSLAAGCVAEGVALTTPRQLSGVWVPASVPRMPPEETYLADGSATPEELAMLRGQCHALGLLRLGGERLSPGLQLAAMTRFGQCAIPKDGHAFEKMVVHSALRGAQVNGFETIVIKLKKQYPPQRGILCFPGAHAKSIVGHLTSSFSKRAAVVLMNGPRAPGFNVAALQLWSEGGCWKMKVTLYSAKHTATQKGWWVAKFSTLGSRPNPPTFTPQQRALRGLKTLLLLARRGRMGGDASLPEYIPFPTPEEDEVSFEAVVQESLNEAPDLTERWTEGNGTEVFEEKFVLSANEFVQHRAHLRPLDGLFLEHAEPEPVLKDDGRWAASRMPDRTKT